MTIGRSIVVFEKDNDPSILKSPYTGKLLSYKKPNRVSWRLFCYCLVVVVLDVKISSTSYINLPVVSFA